MNIQTVVIIAAVIAILALLAMRSGGPRVTTIVRNRKRGPKDDGQ